MRNFISQHKELTGTIVIILSAMIFALYPSATRAVYADAGNILFIILFTTFWRAFTLSIFCLIKKHALFANKQDTKSAIINSIFQTASIIGILGGMMYLPGAIVIVIIFTNTLILYSVYAFKGKEPLNILTIISITVALIGLGLVLNVYDNFQGIHMGGLALAFMASIATAARLYSFEKLVKKQHPSVVGAETFILVMLLCCAGLFFETPVPPSSTQGWLWAWLAAASLSIGTFGMFYGIKLAGAFKVSFFGKLEPVFATIFSAILIHEFLETAQYIGIALIIGSLILYQLLKSKKK